MLPRLCGLLAILSTAAAATRMEGLVIEVEQAQGIVVVAHAPTRSMPAMTMPFKVSKAAQLDGIKPGMRIRFRLDSGSKLTRLEVVKADFGDSIRIPTPASKLNVGDPVPDFTLTDQDGQPVKLSDFHGSVTVINFIYTRCPMPDVCPRQTANFAYLSQKLPEIRLLTITLDPAHDTPEVLREYAGHFTSQQRHWRFLTGDEVAIRAVGGLFGLVYWPEDGVITHTSSTAIVGPDGRLAALVEGSAYRAGQMLALVSSFLQ